ncbi:MAG: alpha/beta hydrolase [Clostridiales bacterium]|jgi:fermentation-respiration switch protein FrsA (DUF1100 family)|nr:alpha/beta hydrolase [Clostridiales bacterium]
MRGRYRAGGSRRKIKTLIKTFMLLAISLLMLFLVCTAISLSKISHIIGKKGLISDYTLTMSNHEVVSDEGKPAIWFEPAIAEETAVYTDEGFRLSALVYRRDEDKWAVLVHGYSTGKEYMQEYARKYYEKGYSILMPDLRAHGDSQGNIVGMGWLDRMDILKWTDLILAENPEADIVLHGISMGASAVMMASGERLPENVSAIIADCGYTTVWDILEYQLKRLYDFPVFPLLHGGNIWSVRKLGYSWKDASAVKMVKASRTPILFVHGSRDDVVPVDMAFELYMAAECDKRLLIIEGAGHAMSASWEPERYWNEIFDFIR